MSVKTRDADIVRDFRGGQTLAEIGRIHGLSRQRIANIVHREGLKRTDGGASKRSAALKLERNVTRAHLLRERWGCDESLFRQLRAMHQDRRHTPIGQFIQQKNNAAQRGIEWKLTLTSWWEAWERSGYYANRGMRVGEYGMTRKWDCGPYERGNIQIETVTQNQETRLLRKRLRRVGSGPRVRIPCARQ